MIDYEFGAWGVGLICKQHGSVFPRALVWATTSALLTAGWCLFFRWSWGGLEHYPDVGGTAFTIVWGGYTFTVGFLLVFRTQIAFSRFWEGATALWAVKGVWVNVVSNLLAFTTADPTKKHEAEAFQHFLVRLMSMLFSVSLESISTVGTEFPTLGQDGIDQEHLDYLENVHDKVEVVLNWVQRLIVKHHRNGALSIEPPILSRVFQELGNGIRELQSAHRIQTCPFPFPYAQAISLFLMTNWVLLPIIAGFFIPQAFSAAAMSFCTLFALAGINYIAAELEMPFGRDPNDLPLHDLQDDFNACMRMLMHPMTKSQPGFAYNKDKHTLCFQGEGRGTTSLLSVKSLFSTPNGGKSRRSYKKELRRKQSALPLQGPTCTVEAAPPKLPPAKNSEEHAEPDRGLLEDLVPPPAAARMSILSDVIDPGQSSSTQSYTITTLAVVSASDDGVGQSLAAAVRTSFPSHSPLETTPTFKSTWVKNGHAACLPDDSVFVL
eukprot:TRINITY_DN8507_c0_g4_i1.p1 TRINITY_DN8507_c0_g4~~TRINITY_DN8507_c0_g4_i1.p1  ORF type:complete len:493 (-),score=48.34 TRINITY_DN8507_c0_g4_i1:596-2074(-)